MKNNVKAICGNWDTGFALDKHTISSDFLGYDQNGRAQFDTKRTEVGEALYQLKYRNDFSKVEPLALGIMEHIVPRLGKIGLVIPMPATNVRPRQPVTEVARALAEHLKVPMFDNILIKTPPKPDEPQLKDIVGKAQKVSALQGRFDINDAIENNGQWSALVVDDLFDTGASMEAATSKLRSYNKIGNVLVATLTWK
jgi:predicted amidophosphoribosyltransferase